MIETVKTEPMDCIHSSSQLSRDTQVDHPGNIVDDSLDILRSECQRRLQA